MVKLDDDIWFPNHEYANEDGILAIGGDLSTERLLLAYENGIFPWYSEEEPILWWSPYNRMVVDIPNYKVPKSVRKSLAHSNFTITINKAFSEVIHHCSTVPRAGQDGTWINEQIIAAYTKLHQLGHAHSIEVWQRDHLVGGMYGIDVGHVFCGESMFSLVPSASKAAFTYIIEHLRLHQYKLLDCQVYNDHLALLGAKEIPRNEFLNILYHNN